MTKPQTKTRPFVPRIAVVFDFDLTLAPDSLDHLFEALPISRAEWEDRYADARRPPDWDDIIGKTTALILGLEDIGHPLTKEMLCERGTAFAPYEGVVEMPERLRREATAICPAIELEFVILSSGYADLIAHTPVASLFDRIWGTTIHFCQQGKALNVKRTLSHPDKALYIQSLADGTSVDGATGPERTNQDVADEDRHVPMDQIIYVGDGESDLQAFAAVERAGGIALAVYQPDGLGTHMAPAERPRDRQPPDYADGGAMLESLILAVKSHAARAELKRRGGA